MGGDILCGGGVREMLRRGGAGEILGGDEAGEILHGGGAREILRWGGAGEILRGDEAGETLREGVGDLSKYFGVVVSLEIHWRILSISESLFPKLLYKACNPPAVDPDIS